jgi:hypothetical protein
VAQLVKGSLQVAQLGGPSRGKQPEAAQMLVQRRVISPDIYSSYDDNKARESTKLMFIASGQEDSLIEWGQATKQHIGTIKSLRGNEMVKDQAEAALEGMTAKAGRNYRGQKCQRACDDGADRSL